MPTSPFGKRLMELRSERGITQTQLADMIGSTQRNISHYETVAELPPSAVLIKIAKALQVSTDDLLGLKPPRPAPKAKEDPEMRRLWKKFQQIQALPEKDRRAVIRLINSLVTSKKAS
jgi:transcriptional regulator with XRE-family HTH domain